MHHRTRTTLVQLVLMYRKSEQAQISPSNFLVPFEGKLSSENRWVIMADLIPWQEFEEEYASIFSSEMGAPAKSFRMARLGIDNQREIGDKR